MTAMPEMREVGGGEGVEEAKDQSRLGEGGAIRVSCYLGNPFHPALLPKKVENCKT